MIDGLSDAALSLYRDAGFHISMSPETAEELRCLAAQGNEEAMMVLGNIRMEGDS